MNARLFAVMALLYPLLSGCSGGTEEDHVCGIAVIEASVANDDARKSGFDPSGIFYWSEKDVIGVQKPEYNGYMHFEPVPIVSGQGTGHGVFAGKILSDAQELYAVYPNNIEHVVSGSGADLQLQFRLLEEYVYDKVDEDFFTVVQGKGNSFNMPMWGKIVPDKESGLRKSVRFRHLGGSFCVKVSSLPAGENMKLELVTGQKLSGLFQVDLTVPEPVLTTRNFPLANRISVLFSNPVAGKSGVFYIPAPVGDYTGVQVWLNGVMLEDFGDFSMARGHLKKLIVE